MEKIIGQIKIWKSHLKIVEENVDIQLRQKTFWAEFEFKYFKDCHVKVMF